MFMEVPKAEVGVQFTYTPLEICLCGPDTPAYEELEEQGYVDHVRYVCSLHSLVRVRQKSSERQGSYCNSST